MLDIFHSATSSFSSKMQPAAFSPPSSGPYKHLTTHGENIFTSPSQQVTGRKPLQSCANNVLYDLVEAAVAATHAEECARRHKKAFEKREIVSPQERRGMMTILHLFPPFLVLLLRNVRSMEIRAVTFADTTRWVS